MNTESFLYDSLYPLYNNDFYASLLMDVIILDIMSFTVNQRNVKKSLTNKLKRIKINVFFYFLLLKIVSASKTDVNLYFCAK